MPPWLIAVLILVGLIIVGIIIWLIYRSTRGEEPGGFDEPCNSKATPVCQTGLTCSAGKCKRSIGSQCSSLSDCVSTATACAVLVGGTQKVCIGSTGATGGGLNQPCLTGNLCNTGFQCLNGLCKADQGQSCTIPTDCVSGICSNGVCSSGNSRLGAPCGATGQSCLSGLVCSNGFCQFPGITGGGFYSYCSSSGPQCNTNFGCRNSVCLPDGGLNGACGSQIPCASPLSCNPNQAVCVFPNNPNSCASGICSTGFTCVNGSCVGASNMGCFSGNQCSSGTCNLNSGIISLSQGGQISIPSGVLMARLPVFSATTNSLIGMSLQPDPTKMGFYYFGATGTIFIKNTGIVSMSQSDGSTLTLTLIDSAGSDSQLFAIYQLVSSTQGHLGNGIFQVQWDSNFNGLLTPYNSTNGLVLINGVQYDPLELDVARSTSLSGPVNMVISAIPHSGSSTNPTLYALPAVLNAGWTAVPGTIPGSQTKPKFYFDPLKPITINPQYEVGYVVGNSMYLAGSMSGIVYSPSGTIINYEMFCSYPQINIIANINSSETYHLENGYLGYGSGVIVNPVPGYVDGNSALNMLSNSVYSMTTSGSCQ